MAWLKRHVYTLALLGMTLVMVYALAEFRSHADRVLYENTLAGCERGNVLRSVVFKNTKSAAQTTPEGTFARQLETLKSIPTTNPITGEVDCDALVEKP